MRGGKGGIDLAFRPAPRSRRFASVHIWNRSGGAGLARLGPLGRPMLGAARFPPSGTSPKKGRPPPEPARLSRGPPRRPSLVDSLYIYI